MNIKTISQLKTKLLAEKESLLLLHTHTRTIDYDPTLSTDSGDRSDQEESWFAKERMSQHWKTELAKINRALNRMNSPSYGVCEDCDESIPVKRLRVRPDATLCLGCQESQEHDFSSMTPSSRPSAPERLWS